MVNMLQVLEVLTGAWLSVQQRIAHRHSSLPDNVKIQVADDHALCLVMF